MKYSEAKVSSLIPSSINMRSSLHKIKRKYFPQQPRTISELIFHEKFTKT